jgi:rhamnosyltransferase subunit B
VTQKLRYIFVPLGSAGDINPLIWLARLMAGRGHEVAMVIQAAMGDASRRAGLPTFTTGSVAQQESVARNPDLWHPLRAFRLLARNFPVWARETIPVVRSQVVPGRTVLVGAGIAFGARIVAEADRVPLVTAQLQPCIFMSPHDAPVLMRGMETLKRQPLWLRRLFYRMGYWQTDQLVRGPINLLRAEHGLRMPVRGILCQWALSPDLVLALFPEWFGPRQPDWPAHTVATRFPLYDEADTRPLPPELGTFLQAGAPPVLLTPGSANMHAHQFFEAGLSACQALGRRALLVTPFKEQLPRSLPANARHFDFLPFSQIYPRCAAVLHHGGVGTCAQGMAAGVPQLIMAMAHDQPDNGWRLRQLGVGEYLYTRQFTGTAVQARLAHLLESTAVRQACEQTRQRMCEQMPPEEVAELLEAVPVKQR